jgi:hypothetical protein
MKKTLVTIVLSLVAIMSVQSAMAWGGWGHHISTYIAEKHLTPEANEKCRHYLKHRLPHYSSWQDYWRHSDPFKEISYWHSSYVDKSYKVVGYKGNITREATYQIERIVKEMEKGKYKKMSDSLVAVNLKLLIHMVPDMHCPSHLVYSKDFGYKGGSIKNRGKKVGRHKFWDGAPMLMHPKWKADRFVQAYDTYSPKQIKKICKGTPTKWSIQNARKMGVTYKMWEPDAEFRKLSKEQREQIDGLLREQLAYGGYRLANILNYIFSK